MTNRNAVLFLHRTSSVLFPPNKYEIKFIPFFCPFQSGVHCDFCCAQCAFVPVAFNFVLEVNEGWEPVMGRAWLLCSDAGTTASSSSDRLLGPKCWPHAAASWRDVAQVRDKTITRLQHMAKGMETGARGW